MNLDGDATPPGLMASSLVTLENAVRNAMPVVQMIPKESLVGDHVANGEVKNAVNEIKRQVRVLKSSYVVTVRDNPCLLVERLFLFRSFQKPVENRSNGSCTC